MALALGEVFQAQSNAAVRAGGHGGNGFERLYRVNVTDHGSPPAPTGDASVVPHADAFSSRGSADTSTAAMTRNRPGGVENFPDLDP
jgi:hypothetical protein